MNNGSPSTSEAVLKQVWSKSPQQTAVAVERRKEKGREADQQDYGISYKPRVRVTGCYDCESDPDDMQVENALNGDSDSDSFSTIQEHPLDDVPVGVAETLEKFHLDKNDSEGPVVALGVAEKQIVVTPPAVAGSAKEQCFEGTSAAGAEDRKEDTSTAVEKDRKADTNPVPAHTDRELETDKKPGLAQPSADFLVSDSSDEPDVPGTW